MLGLGNELAQFCGKHARDFIQLALTDKVLKYSKHLLGEGVDVQGGVGLGSGDFLFNFEQELAL